MKDLKQLISECYGKDLEQRRRWYSPAATAYNQVRPRYPKKLVEQVIEIAQLSANSTILEVGCGPGTATVAFASLGCPMLCLEPNPDFYPLAQQNCESYPNVEIQNLSFEEWPLKPGQFDAVLAASSFHWIPPEIGYPKALKALRPGGCLILLWNKEMQPRYEVHQRLSQIYQAYAPGLDRYEDRATQLGILHELGQMAIASGQFHHLIAGEAETEVVYTVDQYLMLLNTYSPHLKLDPQVKEALFAELRRVINQEFGGRLQLSYPSAFHIARLDLLPQ